MKSASGIPTQESQSETATPQASSDMLHRGGLPSSTPSLPSVPTSDGKMGGAWMPMPPPCPFNPNGANGK